MKKMVRKLIVLLILIMLIAPIAFAASVSETGLAITTDPNQALDVIVTNSDTGKKVQSFTGKNSGESGVLDLNIYSIGAKQLDILVKVFKSDGTVIEESFGPYSTGNKIELNVGLSKPEPEPENVAEEVVNENAEEVTEEPGITGEVTAENEGGKKFLENINWTSVGKIAGGIIIIGVLAFVIVMFVIKRGKLPKNIIVKKQSDLLKEKKEEIADMKEESEDRIGQLEKRIKEIQQEINKIKNEDKIKLAENRVKEEMERLERLKRGEE